MTDRRRRDSIRFHLQVAYAAGVFSGKEGIKNPGAAATEIAVELGAFLERDLFDPAPAPADVSAVEPDVAQRIWYATQGVPCRDCRLPLIAHLNGNAGHEYVAGETEFVAVAG